MRTPESLTEASIFVDEYDDDRLKEITDYTRDMASQLHLPHQEDEWGCVSATGAFIINYALGEDAIDAAELDVAMGREPNTPGDSSKLSPELLKRGLSLEVHVPFSPLREPVEKLARGEIDFDEYLKVYEGCYGPVPEDDYSLLRDYYEQTFIPSWLATEERFAKYKAIGQMITHYDSEISEHLLESLVKEGKVVFATQVAQGNTGVHAIAIFRPELTMPALIFTPNTINNDPRLASRIIPLSEHKFESFNTEAISGIALWEK